MSISQPFYDLQKGLTLFCKKKQPASRENLLVLIKMGVN